MIILKGKAALLYRQAAKQMAREENKTNFQLFGRMAAVTSDNCTYSHGNTPKKRTVATLCQGERERKGSYAPA